MRDIEPVQLAQDLIRFDTINPPGHERDCAHHLGGLLEQAGFDIDYHEFAIGRTTVIARLAGDGDQSPLAMTGHLDTVPFAHQPWTREPLAGEIGDGKLYGRGASDMKSGVAAVVASAVAAARDATPLKRGLLLVLTAGEETGCEGARHVVSLEGVLGTASALLVAEPTSNYPMIGHRGALWLRGAAQGVTAHASMPECGVNAIYKAARAIAKLDDFGFNLKADPLLGSPTINVGTVSGGLNVNSVPDHAEFTIDIRSIGQGSHEQILGQVRSYLGDDVELQSLVDLDAVLSSPEDGFVRCAWEVAGQALDKTVEPCTVPYFTDASILGYALKAPVVILGPGETVLAHQTDEYCHVERIPQAVEIYRGIIDHWCR